MIAPLFGGTLLYIEHSFPVHASMVVYLVTLLCVILLHETARQGGENGERVMMPLSEKSAAMKP
jgi:hypothetical protein